MRNAVLLGLGLLVSTSLLAQQPPAPAPIVSPDIANGGVTFRLAAPDAKQVLLQSGGDIPQVPQRGGLPLTRNAKGVWEVTLPLAPGAYRYTYAVDGVRVTDPSTRLTSESNDNAWSWLHVDGAAWMDANHVPHGAVSEVTYDSSVSGKPRRMHVYTPPGFGMDNKHYPVLYLLHGAFDSDDSWSTVGRAGFILDNLIASGAAKPMIVVMPHGHTGPTRPPAGSPPLPDFVAEFQRDIKPYIESHYPLAGGRNNTALAGLSMGGGQTLDIGFANLADYGYIGVFSSGVFSIANDNGWEQQHLAALDDKALKPGLKLVWFSTGTDDMLIPTTRATVDLLKKHGFTVNYTESTGGHTWINWRDYLHTFAPLLFK
ncbi:MAG TPA: alpha/beta hydrolase-fold protein [Candidatus Acidoferrum sp.]|nr:alpha/beta hydrolase-fold protein [Candidatus Acidoferrum sp.]